MVDNASGDGSAEMVRDEFPWVSLVALDENVGYGAAVNLVAERTATPWLVAGQPGRGGRAGGAGAAGRGRRARIRTRARSPRA